jgi:8-oxo-dGTP diphosphatase
MVPPTENDSGATPVIRIAAAIAVDRDGRFLVVRKRGTGIFLQPGGKIEPHESAREALIRELGEEIGLVVDPSRLMPVGRMSAPAANETATVDAQLFEIIVDEPIRPAAEIEEALWIDLDNIPRIALAHLTEHHIIPFFRARRR